MDPNDTAVKPEPRSPAENSDETSEVGSLDPIIKMEIAFADLPVEIEPSDINRTDFFKRCDGVGDLGIFAAKPERDDGIDISLPDIKQECSEYSRKADRCIGGLLKEQYSNFKVPPAPPTAETCSPEQNKISRKQTRREENKFSCSHCAFTCKRKCGLKIHLLTHNEDKSFACPHCSYKCNQRKYLRRHSLSHTGEKPFPCSQCTYTSNDKANLRRHTLSHTGEKPISCSHCSYTCQRIGQLKSHMFTHTGEKPFTCSLCSYVCNRKEHLRIHLRTHTGEKPYSCSRCSYTCNRKDCLKKHELTHPQ